MRWLCLLLAGCLWSDDFPLAGGDEASREIVKTFVSPGGRDAELDYVQAGGAAGAVFYELDVITDGDRIAIATPRREPDVTWLGDSGFQLQGCFDDYDRNNLARDIAAAMVRGFVVTYTVTC